MPLEVELKYPVSGFADVCRRLEAAGAVPGPVAFERNTVYDDLSRGPAGRLRNAGILLRLRRNAGEGLDPRAAILTVKLPPPGNAPQGFKVRREIETGVADAGAMEAILAGLGYAPLLRYEKVRRTWETPGLHICLDRLPFGRFVEIEGDPDGITACAARLGLDASLARTATYHDLHLEHLDRLGLPREDSFVFDPDTAARLFAVPVLED